MLRRPCVSCSNCTPFPSVSLTRRPPSPTLFPYTTLFRSVRRGGGGRRSRGRGRRVGEHRAAAERGRGEHRARERGAEDRSEEHTSELQSHSDLVCRLLLEKKKTANGLPVLQGLAFRISHE